MDDSSTGKPSGRSLLLAGRLLSPRFNQIAGLIWVLLLASAAVAVLWRSFDSLKQSVQLNAPLVIVSFLLECAGLLVAVPVWRHILACYGVRQSARDDWRIYCYSALGVILPGGIWSIVSRSALYHRLGVSRLQVATASVVETFVMGIAAAGVYGVAVLLRPSINLWQRPVIGFGFAFLALLLIHPRIFGSLSGWMLKRSKPGKELLTLDFGFRELAAWIGLESVVVLSGGLALFVFLTSLIMVQPAVLVQVIAAWAAASAISNLFFWLPGTPVLRDGAMILALTPGLPLPVALIFVALVRIWSIVSLLVVAGFAWLLLDRSYQDALKGYRSRFWKG
jgi:hypothetical protein